VTDALGVIGDVKRRGIPAGEEVSNIIYLKFHMFLLIITLQELKI
jgi:hypothetical protein